MKAAAYLRVSTSGQETDNQIPDVERWFKDHPEYTLVETYKENETSWKQGHQTELSRLLRDLRDGRRKYDVLVIWSIDRICRGGIGPIFNLIDSFARTGCKIVSVKEQWLDMTAPTGDLLLAIVAWVAKFESQRRSDRVKAGLARVRKNGTKTGIPCGKRGKDKNPDGRRKGGYYDRWSRSKKEKAPEEV